MGDKTLLEPPRMSLARSQTKCALIGFAAPILVKIFYLIWKYSLVSFIPKLEWLLQISWQVASLPFFIATLFFRAPLAVYHINQVGVIGVLASGLFNAVTCFFFATVFWHLWRRRGMDADPKARENQKTPPPASTVRLRWVKRGAWTGGIVTILLHFMPIMGSIIGMFQGFAWMAMLIPTYGLYKVFGLHWKVTGPHLPPGMMAAVLIVNTVIGAVLGGFSFYLFKRFSKKN